MEASPQKENGQEQPLSNTYVAASKVSVSTPQDLGSPTPIEDPISNEPLEEEQTLPSAELNSNLNETSACTKEEVPTSEVFILDGTEKLSAQSFLVARIQALFDKSQSIDGFFTIG